MSSSSMVDAHEEAVHDTEHNETFDLAFLFLGFAMVMGCLLKWFCKRYSVPLPFTVTLLLVGCVFGAIHGKWHIGALSDSFTAFANINPHLFLMIFLPPLIFESALNSNYHIMVRESKQILLLAIPGVMIATALTGLAMVSIFQYSGFSIYESLMFGACISATDPVAVVSLLRELGASPRLATMIEGESLLNDGTAYVFFLIFLDFSVGIENSLGDNVVLFIRLALGGVTIGWMLGMFVVWWLRNVYNQPEVEAGISMAGAYVAFWLAESPSAGLGCSGVLSVVVFGLMLSKNKAALSPGTLEFVEGFWEMVAFSCNVIVFFLSGIIIAANLYSEYFNFGDILWLLLLYIVLMCIRSLTLLILYPLLSRAGYGASPQICAVMSWGGLRGAVSLMLALLVTLEPRIEEDVSERFLFLTGGIVLMTLVINGSTTGKVLELVGLTKTNDATTRVYAQALHIINKHSEKNILSLQSSIFYVHANWDKVIESLPCYDGMSRDATYGAFANNAQVSTMDLRELVKEHKCPQLSKARKITKHPSNEQRTPSSTLNRDTLSNTMGELKTRDDLKDLTDDAIICELAKRYISVMKASFEMQFEEGLVTRTAAAVLKTCCDEAGDAQGGDKITQLWAEVQRHLALQSHGHEWDIFNMLGCVNSTNYFFFDAVALSFELLRSYITALEGITFLNELDFGDAELVNSQLAVLSRLREVAHSKWNLYTTSYPEVHETIQTRHATVEVLSHEKKIVEELKDKGILSSKEASAMLIDIDKVEYETMKIHRIKLHSAPSDADQLKLRHLAIMRFFPHGLRKQILQAEFHHREAGTRFFDHTQRNVKNDCIVFVVEGLVRVSLTNRPEFKLVHSSYQAASVLRSMGSVLGAHTMLTGEAVDNYSYVCESDVTYIQFTKSFLDQHLHHETSWNALWQLAAEGILLLRFRAKFLKLYRPNPLSGRHADVNQQARFVCMDSSVVYTRTGDQAHCVFYVQLPMLLMQGSLQTMDTCTETLHAPALVLPGLHIKLSVGSVVVILPDPADVHRVGHRASTEQHLSQKLNRERRAKTRKTGMVVVSNSRGKSLHELARLALRQAKLDAKQSQPHEDTAAPHPTEQEQQTEIEADTVAIGEDEIELTELKQQAVHAKDVVIHM